MFDENMLTAKVKLGKDDPIHRDSINAEKVLLYRGNNITAIISLFRAASNFDDLISCNNLYHYYYYYYYYQFILLWHKNVVHN